MDGPNGAIGHAEIAIGKAQVMLADENTAMHALSPEEMQRRAAAQAKSGA